MQALLDVLKRWRELLILIAFFAGILIVPARIMAQSFIEQTIDSRIDTIEQQITDLQALIAAQDMKAQVGQVRIDSDMTNVKSLLQQLLELQLRLSRRSEP